MNFESNDNAMNETEKGDVNEKVSCFASSFY